jgi:hypothetical protein
LLTGKPAELQWHINVDRTGGKPITRELFRQSKANYVIKNKEVDIVGFYSEKHRAILMARRIHRHLRARHQGEGRKKRDPHPSSLEGRQVSRPH